MNETFADYLRELFTGLGAISLRKLFGGQGLYRDGIIIGLVVGEDLYLKTDAMTVQAFKAAGGTPFVFQGKGKSVAMSYWSLPAEALESADAMQTWAQLAYAAAVRGRANKPVRPKARMSDATRPAKKRLAAITPPTDQAMPWPPPGCALWRCL